MDKRDNKFDNIKAFLIFTVVLGHSLEYLYGTTGIYGIIRAAIYSFHMPAFVFISGHFTKYSKKSLSNVTVTYLSTYCIFNALLALSPARTHSPLYILFPQLIYWYLLCLLIWRISIPALSKIRFILPISIVLTLYIGIYAEADRFLSISRAVCFLPFFLAGYFLSIDRIEKIGKWIAVVLFLLCLSLSCLANYYVIIPVKMYEYIQSYHKTNVGNMEGIIMRAFMLSISFVIIICLIKLFSSRSSKLSTWGKNSLAIYLLHIYPILVFRKLELFNFDNSCVNILFAFAFSILICLFLSIQPISSIYNFVIGKLVSFFCKNKELSDSEIRKNLNT